MVSSHREYSLGMVQGEITSRKIRVSYLGDNRRSQSSSAWPNWKLELVEFFSELGQGNVFPLGPRDLLRARAHSNTEPP